MRLLKVGARGELSLTKNFVENIPPYAILSHTWGSDDDEVTFSDLENGSGKRKTGYAKIQFCKEQVEKDGLQYFWVDTCCIDKANHTELSEAIISMFGWYRDAVKCYVYLSDVSVRKRNNNGQTKQTWEPAFRNSRWFTRGWTLQELLAPASVEFFARGELLGDKSLLEGLIHEITGIPLAALRGAPLSNFSVDERFRWATKRETKRKEDKAYSLLGIFSVFMPPMYGEGKYAFIRLRKEIGVTLDEIDQAIRNSYLRDGSLTIDRLSGKILPMERCFINLGLVDHIRDGDVEKVDDDSDRNSGTGRHLSKFSLDARLRVETPPQANQVTLQTLFRPRKRPDGTTARPNRVLIWGRAGAGKTTLCKKIVHDFIHKHLWSELYDRVLWLPLRRIKLMRNESNNLGGLIREYFSDAFDGQLQAEELQKFLLKHGNRTLFILDGLDEVSYALDPDTSTGRILHRLLNQDNVVITSRPHSTNILDHRPPDLELETVGFFPEQVDEYLRGEISQTGTLEKTILEIRSFIETHPLIQSLVRIPIQLDAICYAWDTKHFPRDNVTMTTLYQAIAQRLWEKDIVRLDKKSDGERITRQQVQDHPDSKRFVEGEVDFLEELAFGGLYNEIVEFNLGHIDKMHTSQRPMLNDSLVHMSFLRSSDNSLNSANRTYHFIHLTFQEFFAAQYLVRLWASDKMISLWKMDSEDPRFFRDAEQITPEEFFRKEKYSARYDIFWRFVVGLLQMEDHRHLHRFFEVLEGEPRDLLGPTHQRLIIHCLSEISTAEGDFRSKVQELEENYRNWISYESRINSSTVLIREAECPTRIFIPLLEGTSEEKLSVMSALKNRPSISSEILDRVICELCKFTDEKVWIAAIQVLGTHSNLISGEKFLDFFPNQSNSMRLTAGKALLDCSRTLGRPAVESLVRLLQDDDRDVQSCAAQALGRRSTLPEGAVEALVRLLQGDNGNVRSCAARALGGQSTLPEGVIEALVRLLQDDDGDVRSCATEALGGQSTLPEGVVEALVRLLQDDDGNVRSCAAWTLGRQVALSEGVVEALVRLLQDEDGNVRYYAAWTLGRESTLPEGVVEALVRLLQDDDGDVRSCVVDALGWQSTLPEGVVEALVRFLQDDDRDARSYAAEALGELSTLPEGAVEALVRLLQDDDGNVRSCAAQALGGQVALSEGAVEALVRLLQDDDGNVRSRAAEALGGQVALSEGAVEALVRLLQDDDGNVRYYAAWTLGRQVALSEGVVEALVRLLQDDDGDVRFCAARALGGQSNLPEGVVEALVRLLQDDDRVVRLRAARALGGQSTLSEFAIKALIRLLQVGGSDELAARILRSQKDFYLLIPNLDPPILQVLLTFLHRESFFTSITCFIWKGILFIDRQGKVQNIPLKKDQQEKIEHAYLKTQKALGIPLPVSWTK